MQLYKTIFAILSFFAISTAWLYYLSLQFQQQDIHFPRDFKDLKKVSKELGQSQKDHYRLVLLLYCSAYLYKQAFAIPGSFFTNIIGGAIFGTWIGFPLVCFLSATGASFCYLLSKCFLRDIFLRWFPERVATMQRLLNENKDTLFFFLLSARLFPGSPNWIMNFSAPIIGVPIVPFYFSVFFGLMPYNFICVHTGAILSSLDSLNDIFSWSTLCGMLFIAVIAAAPGVLLQRRKAHVR